jgi:hypothetical protein
MKSLSLWRAETASLRLTDGDAVHAARVPGKRLLQGLLWAGIVVAVVPAAAAEPAAPPAKLALERQGIRVWTHMAEGNPAVNYRATTVLNSTVTGAANLILDPEIAPQWAPYVHRIEVLSPPDSAGIMVFRMELDLPFPLQDRDVVVRARISRAADGVFTLHGEAVTDARAPVRPGVVRISRYQGGWTIRPVGAGQVEVTTRGYADLGGAVPLSLANLLVPQQLFHMLSNMRDQVGQAGFRHMTASLD